MSSASSSRTQSRRSAGSSYEYTTLSHPRTGRPRTARPRTGLSTLAGVESQKIVCAVSESRGVSPTVGLAFVNLDTCEAVLCQINDSQTYVRTIQKIAIFAPSELLIVRTAAQPKSKLYSIIEEALEDLGCTLTLLERRYFAESSGFTYIQDLAFEEDIEATKSALTGKFYAALKFVEHGFQKSFTMHSLRIKYEPSEGAMMIDISTIYSLELIQNLHNVKSRDCLFGLLNETQTPMGNRLLRSNILQPLTDADTIAARHDALEELTTKEEMFFAIRQGLSANAALPAFVDVDKLLTSLIVVPLMSDVNRAEHDVNDVIQLKHYVQAHCAPHAVNPVEALISSVINDEVKYSKQPLDLRYQRVFAVRSGTNGLLDVARTTYQEGSQDVVDYVNELKQTHGLDFELKYDSVRLYYLRLRAADLDDKEVPTDLVNITKGPKGRLDALTLELKKRNQKVSKINLED
ncbi:MAG: hypothetical protein Q9159_001295 [Coniocarpon cinnabarinum]